MNPQFVIIFADIGQRYIHNVSPQSPVARSAVLEGKCGGVGPLRKIGVGFTPGRGSGIDGFQLRNGKGRFGGVRAWKAVIKIAQIRLLILQLSDDEAPSAGPSRPDARRRWCGYRKNLYIRFMLSPMIAERRCPICRGLATLGPP